MINFNLDIPNIPNQCTALLTKHKTQIDQLLNQPGPLSYERLVPTLETIQHEFHDFWSPISHLNSVMNSDALRDAYNQCLPQLSEFGTWLSQHQALYHAMLALKNAPDFAMRPIDQQTYIAHECRDFELSGIHLNPSDQVIYGQLQATLSQLSAQFEEHILDATDAWGLSIDDETQLSGLPAAALASLKTETGYRLNLQAPCYLAVMTYADDRSLRQTLYTAWVTRASSGTHDNSDTLFNILKNRQQLAKLLKFNHYADYSLVTKMAETANDVIDFLHKLLATAKPFAIQDMAALTTFAQSKGLTDALQPWDIAYYSEKLKEATFAIDEEQLRAYFPIDSVLAGLFEVIQRLYGISISACPNLPTWHPDVRVYQLHDAQGQLIAYCYMDLYARAKKRGGAWMDDAMSLKTDQVPIAYLTCNFRAATGDTPALLSHDDVITLFHECGHCLHHMLTQVPTLGVSGINGVSWDAVELPSQIFENWPWQKEALNFISQHYQTKKPLDPTMIEQMLKAKNFQAGLFLVRQIEMALFDFDLHMSFDATLPYSQIQERLDRIRTLCAVTPQADFNRFQHSFSHIFAGGYGAGYYSYLWAEVLAADAFSKFLADGIFNPETGKAFRKAILAKGGSEPAAKLFKDFRGRAPDINALLASYGLI